MDKPYPRLSPEQLDAAFDIVAESGGIARIRIPEGQRSMLPTLRPGQLLAVECFPERDRDERLISRLRPGDLLVFRQADYRAVHRLLGRARLGQGRPTLRTRGDGAPGLDPAVPTERVLGRVTAFRDERGWWSLVGRGARLYARGVAWHSLIWSAAGVGAAIGDKLLARLGLRPLLRPFVGLTDRLALGIAHRLLFRVAHRRVAAGLPGDGQAEGGGAEAAP